MQRIPRILQLTLILVLLVLLAGCRPMSKMARHFWEHHLEEFHTDDHHFMHGTIPHRADVTAIEIYHFSDYHSHALPDFAEGEPSRGGIARVVGLLEAVKAHNDNVLAFNGGDMMNLSNPIWSDEYTCTEWSWFNGVIDGMALGNHELDYGPETFTECANTVTYPILSSGLVYSATMEAVLPEYQVYNVDGVRIGVFAVVGDDYPGIVRPELIPEGTRWLTGEEKLARVTEIVTTLRETEAADVVLSIGHQSRAEDEAMAQAVPGIDLILGTHSHLKVPLTQIEGTETYYISPFQYLGYVSHVTLHVADGELVEVSGELVAIDETTPQDHLLAEKVEAMQEELEEQHPERFEVLGEAATLLDNTDINLGETGIGNFVTDLARQAVDAHAFFSTSSSFRAALPPGPITQEDYLTALPYANTIVTTTMQGGQLLDLVDLSASKRGSDAFSQLSGVRYTLDLTAGTVSNVQVISDPTDPTAAYVDLDPDATYEVATTNFQALIAADYKDRFAEAGTLVNTEIDINELVVEYIRNNSPISATVDGRVQVIE